MLMCAVLCAVRCLQVNEPGRAVQLRGAIERLGPAYVKVAQALSTRVDLLSPQYFAQIQLLQDRVPPFPCEQAKEVRWSMSTCTCSCSGCDWLLYNQWSDRRQLTQAGLVRLSRCKAHTFLAALPCSR